MTPIAFRYRELNENTVILHIHMYNVILYIYTTLTQPIYHIYAVLHIVSLKNMVIRNGGYTFVIHTFM